MPLNKILEGANKMEFKETEEKITLHGLGFLQVKLVGGQRLNVWHPELPRRKCFESSSIHDHRFGFKSTVLVGIQINTTFVHYLGYEGRAQYMSYLHEGSRTQYGNRSWTPDGLVHLVAEGVQTVVAGQTYAMDPYVFHSTKPGGDGRVATLMTKVYEGNRGAHSLCKIDVEPDVDFDRKCWPEDDLWAIVNDVLGKRN